MSGPSPRSAKAVQTEPERYEGKQGSFPKKDSGNAEFDREDRGAEGFEGVRCGEGRALPRKNFRFWILSIGEIWCKLSAFCTVHLKLV